MTRIVIERVNDYADLLNALSVVAQVFADADLYDTEEQVFRKTFPPAPPSIPDENPEPPELPAPLTACPGRGTHVRLTDCWLCWSDVMRGAAVETDVLADDWDNALSGLTDSPEDGP